MIQSVLNSACALAFAGALVWSAPAGAFAQDAAAPAAPAAEAAPAAAPAAEAAPAAAPTPAPAPTVSDLVDQLMKANPDEVKAKLEALKAEAAKMNEEAKNLRAQADQLDAKASDVVKRVQVLEQLLGLVPPPATSDAAPAAPAEEKMTAAAAPAEAPKEEPKMAEAAPAPPTAEASMPAAAPAAFKYTFDKDIRPILMGKCAKCHNASQAKGGFASDKFESILAGGASGVVLVPGNAAGSRFYRLIAHEEEPAMPMGGAKLEDAVLEIIRTWINEGAPKDANSKVEAKKEDVAAMAPAPEPVVDEGAPPMPAGLPAAQLAKLEGPLAIRSIAASPNAPLLAVSGLKQILLYSSENQQLIGALDFPEGTPERLKFSPNGTLLVAAGGEGGKIGVAAVYDVVSGRRLADYGMTFDTLLTADITLDHKQVVLGGANKVVQVYKTEGGAMQYEIKTHTDWITATAFSPDGWFLATADRAGGMYVWLAETGRDAFNLRGHEAAINAIDFRADSKVLASASDDGTIRLWELDNGGQIKSWGHGSQVLSVVFARDGRLLSSGVDGSAKLWQGDGNPIVAFPPLGDWAYAAALTMKDSRVVAGSWLGQIKVWDVEGAKDVGMLSLEPPKSAETVVASAAQ